MRVRSRKSVSRSFAVRDRVKDAVVGACVPLFYEIGCRFLSFFFFLLVAVCERSRSGSCWRVNVCLRRWQLMAGSRRFDGDWFSLTTLLLVAGLSSVSSPLSRLFSDS